MKQTNTNTQKKQNTKKHKEQQNSDLLCNREELVCNSCLVRNLNSYIYLLCSTFLPSYFKTLISTTGMTHLNNSIYMFLMCVCFN